MSLIKWEPFGDIDRFFEDLPLFQKTGWDLAVDMYEKNNNIIVEMNVPGVGQDNIHVSVEDNHLRVTGSREESKEEKKKHYYSKEIRRGSFERLVRLPDVVQKEHVSAKFKDGMLMVTLPKVAEGHAGEVEVEVEK